MFRHDPPPTMNDAVSRWIPAFAAGKQNRRSEMAAIRDQRADYLQKPSRLAAAFEAEFGRPMLIGDLFGPAPDALLRSFVDQRRRRPTPLRPSSRDSYRRVVNALVTYLHDQGLEGPVRVPWSIEDKRRHDVRTFGPSDIERMFVALNKRDTIANRRLAALIAMSLDHGARRGDALSLRLSKLDLRSRRAVLSVKRDKEIEVPLGELAVRAVRRYLEVRVDAGRHDFVFLNVDGGGPVSGNAIGAAFRRLLLQLGIVSRPHQREHDDAGAEPQRLNFQTLRRTFVKHYLRAGRSERELIAILGWDPEYAHQVFEHYTAVDIDDLAAVHEESSPLSRILGAAA